MSVESEREPRERNCGEQGGNGTGQPRRGFTYSKPFEGEPCAPVEKRRLLKPGASIQARGGPVMRLHHVSRNPRIARFIGPEETNYAQMAEVAYIQGRANEQAPDNEGASGCVEIR